MTEWQKEDVIDVVEPDAGVGSSYHTVWHMVNSYQTPVTDSQYVSTHPTNLSPSFLILIDTPGIVRPKALFAKMRHLTEEHDTANKGNLQNLLF